MEHSALSVSSPFADAAVFRISAFSADPQQGNPAIVVLAGRGTDVNAVSAEQMIQYASGFRRETVFVFPPATPQGRAELRFFTPMQPAAFVGHAAVAALFVISAQHVAAADAQGRIDLGTTGGVVSCTIMPSSGEFGLPVVRPATMQVLDLHTGQQFQNLVPRLLQALGMDPEADRDVLLLERAPPLLVRGASSSRLLVGVRSAADFERMHPDFAAITEITKSVNVGGIFLSALLSETAEAIHTESRMLCPGIGHIKEDCVSGIAHGYLAFAWEFFNLLRGRQLVGHQGRFVNSTGEVRVTLHGDTACVSGQGALSQESPFT